MVMTHHAKGRLVVFEGANEVGKSTLAALLYTELRSRQIHCEMVAFPGNKAGTLGRHVYELHHRPDHFSIYGIDPTSLQVLHVAAHIDAIETIIKPAMQAGHVIILDRFWWSTLIYGNVLQANMKSLDMLVEMEQLHWNNIIPDCIFLVTRASPISPLYDLEKWNSIARNYVCLAEREASKNKIEIIANDTALEDAFGAVQALLPWITRATR
jgi:thymidylate kinase